METKLTNINKLRNPNFLGGWDLIDENGKTINKVFTIKEIKVEQVFNQKSQAEVDALTIIFTDAKPMILNATNRKTLCKVLGTEYIEEMAGKKIELTTKKIKAFGEMHDALRIVPIKVAEQVQVDVIGLTAKLNSCKTAEELKTTWLALKEFEQKNTDLYNLKEQLKTTLK